MERGGREEGTNENVGRELRIAGIPVPNRGLYIILAPYQVRITPRRCAQRRPLRRNHPLSRGARPFGN